MRPQALFLLCTLACTGNINPSESDQSEIQVGDTGDCSIQTFYVDNDGDGFGDPNTAVERCKPPPGAVSQGGDCNDADPLIAPDAAELCDGVDNDCDEVVDSNTVPFDFPTIQAAIDAVADGETVCVGPGSYSDPWSVSGRSLAVRAAEGRLQTTLDLSDVAGSLVTAEGPDTDLTLSGFTIAGYDGTSGYGVLLNLTEGTGRLEDIRFTNHTFRLPNDGFAGIQGGLLRARPGHFVLENIEIDDLNVEFIDNEGTRSTDVAGLFLYAEGGSVAMNDIQISNVRASGSPYASFVSGLVALTHNASFTAADIVVLDVSVDVSADDDARLVGTLFNGSDSEWAVERITLERVDAIATGSDLVLGTGHLHCRDCTGSIGDLEAHDNVLSFGSATAFPLARGGVFAYTGAGPFEVSGLNATGNVARTVGPNGVTEGGVIWSLGNVSYKWLDLRDNDAIGAQAYGGAMWISGTDVAPTLHNSILAGNTVGLSGTTAHARGGGLYMQGDEFRPFISHLDVVGNEIIAEFAQGGGLWNGADVSSVKHVNVVGNRVAGAQLGLGAAIFSTTAPVWLYNNAFSNTGADAFSGTLNDPGTSGGNLQVDPQYVDHASGDPRDWDLNLTAGSPVADAGEPGCDVDLSPCAFGAYGGPDGGW